MDYLPAIATLCLGFIFGYLGQRARVCCIGGMRDWWLVKDTYLLKGLFAFFISALIGFSIFHFLAPAIKTFPWFINGGNLFAAKWSKIGVSATPSFMLPVPGDPITWSYKIGAHLILAIIGGLGVGFISTFAGGCPFRQHVMAAEGSRSAILYIFGLIVGAILFHKIIAPFVKALLL